MKRWRYWELWETPIDWAGRVRRICAWLPLLWRDRDWDQAFLVRIVEYKLRRMADCIERNQIVMSADRTARDLRIAAEHLHRYLHPEKQAAPYPGEFPKFVDVPGSTNRMLQPSTPAQTRHHKREAAREEAHWNAAWEMIRRRGRTWWD